MASLNIGDVYMLQTPCKVLFVDTNNGIMQFLTYGNVA
mgnify:CR=1 FL=1